MATDVETLLARIEVQTSRFERQMERARSQADRQTRAIEQRFVDANKTLSKTLDGVSFDGLISGARSAVAALGPLGAALGGAFSISAFTTAADTFTRTINALKVAGLEGRQLTDAYEQLFAVAQRQGAPIEQLSRLYGQLAQAQGDLKVSSQDIMTVVEGTAAALRVSGVPAAQASGAILGLSQALSGGTVRAEEFNQMLEGGMRPALQAVANNILEAGGSVGKLRELVTEGEVSSRLFFEAMKRGTPQMTELASTADVTVSQALTKLGNVLVDLAGQLNRATNATGLIATGLDKVGDAASAAVPKIISLVNALGDAIGLAGRLGAAINQIGASVAGANFAPKSASGIAELRDELGQLEAQLTAGRSRSRDIAGFDALNGNLINRVQDLRNRIAEAERLQRQIAPLDPAEAGREANRGQAFGRVVPKADAKPISINDPRFRNVEDEESGASRAARAQRISDYEREVQALNKRTAALNLDIATFGQSAQAISRAKVEQDLLNALQKDGVTVSDEQRAKVGELAQAYVEAEERLRTMKDAQAAQNELTKFAGTAISSFFSDVVSGGKNAEQALMNLTKRLADAAFQAVLLGEGPLSQVLGTRGTGGIVGGLFKGLRGLIGFSQGGYTGGGGRNEPAGVVHGGEYVFSKAAVERLGVGNLDAMHRRARGFAAGGYVGPAAMPSSSRAAAPVTVNIINNSKSSVSAQERNEGGGRSLEVVIDEMVAGKINTPGSRTRGAMSAGFGVAAPLTRR